MLVGCGGAPSELVDGGVDAGSVFALVEAPMPPRPVQRFDCPAEWAADTSGCTPVPIPRCELGERASPGDDACRAVGTPCSEGWPDLVGPALYVRLDASGVGTADDPGALDDMLERASPGTTVVVAPGTYPGEHVLRTGVRLLGVCPRVVLTGAVSSDTGTLSIEGTDVSVENLTIAPLGQSAIVALAGASLTLNDVSIVGASEIAIFLEGATLRSERLAIRDLRAPNPLAIFVGDGSRLEGEDVYVRNAGGVGILVAGGTANLTRSSVLDTRGDEGVLGGEPVAVGVALLVDDGGSATLEDFSIRGALGAGVFVRGSSSLAGRRVAVSEVRAASDARFAVTRGSAWVVGEASGVELEDLSITDVEAVGLDVAGARLTARRASVTAPVGAIAGADGRMELREVLVRGVEGGVSSLSGSMVSVADAVVTGAGPESFQNPAFFAEASELELTRALVEDWRGVAVLARGRSRFRGEDLDVRRLLPTMRDRTGDRAADAIAVIEESEATVARLRIADQTGVGIEVTNATLDLEDSTIERLRPSDQLGARGLASFRGTVSLRRASFRDLVGWAIDAYEASAIDATDVHVEQLAPEYFGYGTAVQVRGASTITVSRANVVGAYGVGLRADDSGSAIDAMETTVRTISPRRCAMVECTSEPGGIGVLATDGARVSLRLFDVAEASLCGVMVGPEGTLELTEGSIRSSAVGACVRADDYPIVGLTEGVRYEDNGLTIDSAASPVPSLPPPWQPPPR